LSVQIVHSRICDNLFSSLFIFNGNVGDRTGGGDTAVAIGGVGVVGGGSEGGGNDGGGDEIGTVLEEPTDAAILGW
jgi:hypothetical protein